MPVIDLVIIIFRFGKRLPTAAVHVIGGVSLLLSVVNAFGLSLIHVLRLLRVLACHCFSDWGPNNPAFVVAFSQLGKFCYTFTFGAIYLLPPDLYPTNLRATGLGLCQAFGLTGYIIAPLFRLVVSERASYTLLLRTW